MAVRWYLGQGAGGNLQRNPESGYSGFLFGFRPEIDCAGFVYFATATVTILESGFQFAVMPPEIVFLCYQSREALAGNSAAAVQGMGI